MTHRINTLVVHASELVTPSPALDGAARGARLDRLEVIPDGALAIDDGRVVAIGNTADLLARYDAEHVVDANGRLVSPAFVDPHTHLLYGGSRHDEWQGKVLERAVPGIDAGIRTTIAATRAASDAELTERALADLDEALAHGTVVLEAKTGYGLDPDSETRLLRLTKALDHPVHVPATYLGAHTVPAEYLDDRDGYIRTVLDTLPRIAATADFCDVACDPVSFTAKESRRIAEAARALGLRLKFHADQTGDIGGTELAVEFGAVSVDHLDEASDAALRTLAASDTVGVVFPGANYHLLDMTASLAPGGRPAKDLAAWASRVLGSGAAIALSTDYNPGTAPSLSMQAVMQLAARLYRWSYSQVWHMATLNAAAALGLESTRGSLAPGKAADFVVWSVRSHGEVVHRFGTNMADRVYTGGRLVAERGRRLSPGTTKRACSTAI
ncbi:imidazolonepropionase [Streptomyces sp. S3(2020)]|uniref:imidazolonepropionase n=1 Tax=Streptomyces sp. S3(2020) TaxID=2732044 RepID=UPI0014897F82|nr:imidazolonepropionase [Streptomyces sp. S3(2020)]NNN29168.1 imidazolonepropionase [Streptomyces sp. S3(2020)]